MTRTGSKTTLALLASMTAAFAQQPAADVVVVRGRLLDEAGKPAADVTVSRVTDAPWTTEAAVAAPLARTDHDGAFEVQVPLATEGETWLLLGGERFAATRLRLPDAPTTLELGAIGLPRGVVVTGRVRTADGEPLTGALVTGIDLLPALVGSSDDSAPRGQTRATIGDDGRMRLPGMVQSLGELRVSCPGYYDAVLAPFAIGTPFDVMLQRARVVTGVVIDADAQPAAGAVVRAGAATATTDAAGRYSLTLRDPETWSISAHRGDGPGRSTPGIALLPDTTEIDLRLPAVPATLRPPVTVRAIDADGAPLQRFEVFVNWYGGRGTQRWATPWTLAKALASDGWHAVATDGEAHLAGPHGWDTDYELLVRAPGHGWGARTGSQPDDVQQAARPLTVQMQRSNDLRGSVIDADTGAPLEDVVIVPSIPFDAVVVPGMPAPAVSSLTSSPGPDATRSDASGAWQLRDLPAEQLMLFVVIDGRVIGPSHDVDLRHGQTAPLTLRAPGRRILHATLRAADRADLLLQLSVGAADSSRHYAERRNMIASLHGATPVAHDGSFASTPLAPIPWHLEALLPLPPRNAERQRLPLEDWDGAAPPAEPLELHMLPQRTVTGTVGGEVPWSRLGVVAQPPGPIAPPYYMPKTRVVAPLGPDRSFCMRLPEDRWQLQLVDLWTQAPLETRDVEKLPIEPMHWRGEAVCQRVRILSDRGRSPTCTLSVRHQDEDQRAQGNLPVTLAHCTARGNELVELWLPHREGSLSVSASGATLTMTLAELSGELTVRLDDDGLRRD